MVSKIFSRNGRILCSPRDPHKEAQQWSQRQPQFRPGLPVLIVGVGAGYHVAEFAKTNSQISIYAFDLDEATLRNFTEVFGSYNNLKLLGQQDMDLILPQFPYVLAFKAAWQGLEKEFLSAYMYLLGQSQGGFLNQAQRAGLDSKYESLNQEPITIKTIGDHVSGQNGHLDEVKIWKCLRELVR